MVTVAKPPSVLVPSARTPGQFAGPGIAGGVGQAGVALGRSVRALARPLLGWAEQIAQVQDAGDEAKFLGIVNTERAAMRAFMEANPSLYPEFEAKWGESEVKIQKAAESVMRKRVQDRLQDYIKKNSPIWKATVTKNIQDGVVLQTKVDTLDTKDKIVISDLRDDAKAATGLARGISSFLKEEDIQKVVVTEKELKLVEIENLIDKANVNGMLWNPLEVRALLNSAERAIDTYEDTRNLAEESEVIYQAINNKDYDSARELLKKANITEKQKAELHIKINASENQNEQRLENKERDLQTENQAKIASDIYANELDASVIDSNINAALLADEEGVRGLTVTMAKSLKELNKRGDVVTSDEANIEIDRLLRSVRAGEKTYDEAIEKYTTEIAKNVNPTEGAKNLDNIRTAADSAKDPILSKPTVMRGHQALDRVRAAAIRLLGTEPEIKDIVDIEDKILRRATALDEWAVQNKDDPNFTEKFQSEVKKQLTPLAEEITLDWFERWMRPKETTPFWRHFGTTEEKALARKKAKAGIKEELSGPGTLVEFEDNVRLLDEKEAKAYYEKWKDKW